MAFLSHAAVRWPQIALVAFAATALWLLLVNRWLMAWVDGPAKTFSIAAALPALLAAAWFVSRAPAARGVAVVAAGMVVAGEARRVALRASYRVEGVAAASEIATLAKPVTTTDLAVRHFDVALPAMGEGRLRIAHLSDLHIGGALSFDFYVKAIDLVRAERPDVVVITGDFLEGAEWLPLLERWAALAASAAPRVVYSLGNHDYWIDREAVQGVLERAGIERATGRIVELRPARPRIVATGTDAPWADDAAQLDAQAAVRIVLSHAPDNIYDLARRGASVVFAGHHHGGQIRLPLIGALVVPSRYGRRFDRGRFHVQGTDLIVSAGVGAEHPALRVYCPPEVVVVDLVGSAGARAS
jgi:predicted MPP superfamily phosphohydrolase